MIRWLIAGQHEADHYGAQGATPPTAMERVIEAPRFQAPSSLGVGADGYLAVFVPPEKLPPPNSINRWAQ